MEQGEGWPRRQGSEAEGLGGKAQEGPRVQQAQSSWGSGVPGTFDRGRVSEGETQQRPDHVGLLRVQEDS